MKKFKNLARTGVFTLLAAAVTYFAVNGYNLTDSNSVKQLAHNDQKYSEVRIYAKDEADMERIINAGLFIDHANRKPGYFLDAWLSEQEIELLRSTGIPYDVLIDDWDTYYNNRQNLMTPAELDAQMREVEERDNITHSIFGTLNNGCLRYSEVVAKLDSIRTEYPNLVSQKFSIGSSYENRTIWAVRITKNPDAPTGRPEVLYHALIHAREPVSMENQLYYIYWLLENYGIDPMATYILNNREIYWVPVFNPDGYVYNEPGGGFWRKNRKPCGSGTGTDLNRNFGIYQFWNSTNGGSSTSCGSDTYRGSSPFSEPESQAIANFVNSRNFKAGLGAHTYGNYLIKPWAWIDPTPTPDDDKFNVFLADATIYNHYTTGTPLQTVGYRVRGSADDWYYQDSAHNSTQRAFVMTPETGSSFWPSQSQILPLCAGMLWTNQYISLIAGAYVNPVSKTFNLPNYNPGQSGDFKLVFRNKGLMDASNVKVQLIPWNSFVSIPTQEYTYASLLSFSTDSATFNFTVAANAPVNCAVPTTLNLKIDTSVIYTETMYIYVGSGAITLNDDAESGIGNWTVQGGWSLHTDTYHSPSHSFAYAPYPNNADYSLTLANPVNTQSAPVCYLNFWTRYDLEAGYDFGYVEISSDNGSTWQSVTAVNGTNLTWTEYSYDVTQYANASTQVKIRFRLNSDVFITGQGWWVDDIKLTNYCLGTVGTPGLSNVPKTYAIGQNYPNPFNPVTVIKFQLPQPEDVSIKVFDLLGREVAVLLDERKEPGYYEVSFDGGNMASGLYFYRIKAGSFTETKKMILIK